MEQKIKEKFIYRKFLAALTSLLLLLVFGLPAILGLQNIARAAEDDFLRGDGSDTNPYIIATFEHLANMGKSQYFDSSFKLANDINLKNFLDQDDGWEPIGTLSEPFSGSLDGNGYSIINLFINRPDEDYVGLFGCVNNAAIKNLNIVIDKDEKITGKSYVGGIAGYAENSTVESCSVYGSLTSENTGALGGLIGKTNTVDISCSYFCGALDGFNCAGGIAGFSEDTAVENCYVKAKILSGVNGAGGVFGNSIQSDNRIDFCYVNLTEDSDDAFFKIAKTEAECAIANSYGVGPYYNREAIHNNQIGVKILKESEYKTMAAYTGFNNTVWGIFEGKTTPYLKVFNNVVLIEPEGKIYDGTNEFNENIQFIGKYDEDKPIEVEFSSEVNRDNYIAAGLYDAGIDYKTEYPYQIFIAPYQISKAVLTVKANDCSQTLGGISAVFEYTITGYKGSDDISAIDQLSLNSIVIKLKDSDMRRGENIIEISGELDAHDYTFEFENGILTVTGFYTYEIILITLGAVILLVLIVYIIYLTAVKKRTLKDFGRAVKKIFIKEKTVEIIKEVPILGQPLPIELFTPREKEVADLLLAGKSRSEIAKILFISEHTVKSHTQNVFEKTEVNNQRAFITKYLIGESVEGQKEEE